MGWTAFGAGVATVAVWSITIWQAISSSDSHSRAEKLKTSDGAISDSERYGALMREGDAAGKRSAIAGVGAGACALATGILGYLAYKQTGEIGPFRF